MENGKDTGTDTGTGAELNRNGLHNGSAERDGSGASLMVFEEDLRRAAGARSLGSKEQGSWVALRRSLPISRWAERPGQAVGRKETARLSRELDRYREAFEAEAAELGLSLDMSVNYYSRALGLVLECRRRKSFDSADRKALRELMVLVDWKDAVLGLQILQSMV
ncbi:hypothetical protein LLH00_03875 [bacterium]|nr:hypothetical protein [bacterium]